MGFAIAEAFAKQGAEVTLIAGPVSLPSPQGNIHRINVVSAQDMFDATNTHFKACDIAVFCAAVADFTPTHTSTQKVKREKDNLQIELTPTKDIAAHMGLLKQEHQTLVGFALETHDESFNAQKKLVKKNLDYIVLNSLQDKGAGFMHNTNKITVFTKNNPPLAYPLLSKTEVAMRLVALLTDCE